MTKKIAAILAVMTMITAVSAFAITANAATLAIGTSASQSETSRSDLTGREMKFSYMTDVNGDFVNPYMIFGTSFRSVDNKMILNKDGTFKIVLGVSKEGFIGGRYTYNAASEKLTLRYSDSFNAAGYVVILNDGSRALSVPVRICGNIYNLYFSI